MKRLLIANRGEIAVRVARTAREMGLRTIGVASDADREALHARVLDDVVPIGPAEPRSSYLSFEAILGAARASGADAIHPGYGFLSENAAFAQAVLDAGLTWVGPPPAAMAALGDKLSGRRAALAAGVPVLRGTTSDDPAEVLALGLPILVKASGGGGGRGMRVVRTAEELPGALSSAREEAASAFGDPTVYAERYVARPRHVEVQIVGDRHGRVVAWGERECSVQRRHQKLVEESPCVVLSPARREALHAAAVRLARSAGYHGAGTLEFLLDEDGDFHFLEMNARLQVEHPVTELVYGVDLVREQLRVAMGEAASEPGAPHGHAIECRIVAEDPASGFTPSPGRITALSWPTGPGVRVDAGYEAGDVVSPHYDALIAKVIVHAPDRAAACARMLRALAETQILGIATTAEYSAAVVGHPAFAAADLATDFLDRHFADWAPPVVDDALFLAAAALAGRGATAEPGRAAVLPTPWQTLGRWGTG